MLPLHQSPKDQTHSNFSMNGANSRNNCCACLVVVGQDGVAPPEFENSRFTVYPATTYGILTHNWHPVEELNFYIKIRNLVFYPLN